MRDIDEFDPDEYEDFYLEGSEESYQETTARHGKPGVQTPDHGAYLPTPMEIRNRIKWMRWLESKGFSAAFVTSVMTYDTPSIGHAAFLWATRPVKDIEKQWAPYIVHEDGKFVDEEDDDGCDSRAVPEDEDGSGGSSKTGGTSGGPPAT